MFLQDLYCNKCQKDTQHCNNMCSVCKEKEEKKRIRKWRAMSANKKLDDLRQRVEKLEQGPMRY